MWKTPPSGQKCILTVYVIIELGARSGQVGFGQPAPADRAPKPVYWID